jgi:UDP-N-acetylglucosamine acyltransferase
VSKIHHTAIISEKAELAEDVEVGPYAVIEDHAEIGPGCVIQAHAIISGRVKMGRDCTIGYGAVIGSPPQDYAWTPDRRSGVTLGDNNLIREYVTIHRGTEDGSETVVGNNNFLMCGVHLGHNVRLEDHIVIANNCLLAGVVQVGERSFLGGGSVFHQFMRIGAFTMVKGGCRFGKDIPPFLIATGENGVAGLNIVGLRRNDFSAEERKEVKEAFRLLYKSGRNVSQALDEARKRSWGPHGTRFFEFVGSAEKRGICKLE